MKKKLFGFLAAFLAFTSLGIMSACGEKIPDGGNSTPDDSSTPGQSTPWGEEMDCRVTITTEGGMRISGVTVCAFDEDGVLVKEVTTNSQGIAELFLEEGEYTVSVKDLPLGMYYLTGLDGKLTPESPEKHVIYVTELVDQEDREGHIYSIGDVMHDFEIETLNGEVLTLSEMLEEKDMVMLNFWYMECSPCLGEMPDFSEVYNDPRFADQFELIAIHHNMGYSLNNVRGFVANQNPQDPTKGHPLYPALWKDKNFAIDYPVSHFDLTDIQNYMGSFQGWPTTYIIDRYGVVAYIAVGAFSSVEEFMLRVDKYLGSDYKQDFSNSGDVDTGDLDDLIWIEPTVPDPTDDELNAALGSDNLTFSFDENEYVWPFIPTQKDGRDCIYAPNGQLAGLYAPMTTSILNVHVDVPETGYEDYVFTFDYKISCEGGGDYFHVLVDGVPMKTYTGVDLEWKTCYAYVPVKGGEHVLSLAYAKDLTDSEGDDTVYISNLRFESLGENSTTVLRYAATERLSDKEGYKTENDAPETSPRFGKYATVVLNATDGLYHVNTVDGPILFTDLSDTATQWCTYSIYDMAVNDFFIYEDNGAIGDLEPILAQYANAELHSDNGYVPVTEELAQILQFMTEQFGSGQENEWLELCCYFDAYNTDHVPNPCVGVHFYFAIEIPEMDYSQEVPEVRAVVDIQKAIMPRGYKYLFTPTKSGVYTIFSDRTISKDASKLDPSAFFTSTDLKYDENGAVIFEHESDAEIGDFLFTVRLTAGQSYYIAAADWNPQFTGDKYELVIRYHGGETVKTLTECATPPYVSILGPDGASIGERADGIAFGFDSDGFARELKHDSTFGSYIYVDLIAPTRFFESTTTLQALLSSNMRDEETGLVINFNMSDMQDENGNAYPDYTDLMTAALEEALAVDKDSELYGMVKVTEDIYQALRLLTIKIHGKEFYDSWQCMCYYYKET